MKVPRRTRAGTVAQCYNIRPATRERLRLAKIIMESELGRRVSYDELFRAMADAVINAALQRARRAGKHPPDVLAQAKAQLALTAMAKPTTHGPAPTAGSVYEH